MSDGVILTNLVPDPAADDHKTLPVTISTEDSEDDFCMEVHGDEGCVWDYENMSGDIVRPCERAFTELEKGNHMKEDRIDTVVVSQVVVAIGPGLDPVNINARKEDPSQLEPANKTDGTSPTGSQELWTQAWVRLVGTLLRVWTMTEVKVMNLLP